LLAAFSINTQQTAYYGNTNPFSLSTRELSFRQVRIIERRKHAASQPQIFVYSGNGNTN